MDRIKACAMNLRLSGTLWVLDSWPLCQAGTVDLVKEKKDNCAHIKKDENAGRGRSSRLCR